MKDKTLSVSPKSKKVTLRDFAWRCARKTDVLIDIPDDAPIPREFIPKTKAYDQKIELLKMGIERIKNWGPARLVLQEAELGADYKKKMEKYRRDLKASLNRKKRYEPLLAQVESWRPPTHYHEDLKEIMISELKKACGDSPQEPEKISAKTYQKRLIEERRREITILTEEKKRDIENCEFKTKWVRQLRESLWPKHSRHYS